MKNPYRQINRKNYSLGELIEIVTSVASNKREAIAALADLFGSGRVRLGRTGHAKRVKVALA